MFHCKNPIMVWGGLSPKRLREHREGVLAFFNAYSAYLDAAVVPTSQATESEKWRLRNAAIETMPAAQVGLDIAGVRLAFPGNPGGPMLRGLANTAFLHEQPGYRLYGWAGYKPTFADVADSLRLAIHSLEQQIREAERRRRNPLYWGDRGLRAVLGIPAYLLSLLIPVSRQQIDDSWLGAFLKLVPLIALGVAIYFGGAGKGWW